MMVLGKPESLISALPGRHLIPVAKDTIKVYLYCVFCIVFPGRRAINSHCSLLLTKHRVVPRNIYFYGCKQLKSFSDVPNPFMYKLVDAGISDLRQKGFASQDVKILK